MIDVRAVALFRKEDKMTTADGVYVPVSVMICFCAFVGSATLVFFGILNATVNFRCDKPRAGGLWLTAAVAALVITQFTFVLLRSGRDPATSQPAAQTAPK